MSDDTNPFPDQHRKQQTTYNEKHDEHLIT